MTTKRISKAEQQQNEIQALAWGNQELLERLAELELQLEDKGWQALGDMAGREFSREGLREICRLARLYWLKNPLIQRGVNVQSYYVFGQGVEIVAEDEAVNAVVQDFLSDSKNQSELTAHQALLLKECELTLFGNLFFAFFINPATGHMRVRTIPVDEIDEIICNPEDGKDPWYYKRTFTQVDMTGMTKTATVYYKDWRYVGKEKPAGRVDPAPVYHVKVGCLSDMRFGVSEVYAALDWAKAYKEFLENWATIVKAYARFAWQLKTKGAPGSIAKAKTKLGTTLGTSSSEANPPPVTGSVFIGQEGVDMQPVRTAGATTSAEDGRRLLLMVAACTGLPESFFGDVSVGTLATARSLDRPTELKFVSRRTLWADVLQNIANFAVLQAVIARRLPGTVIFDNDGTPVLTLAQIADPDTGEMVDRDLTVRVNFPPILEHDVVALVDAIVKAATLGRAGVLAGTIDTKTVTRMLLSALGERDIDAMLAVIYPPEEEQPGEPVPGTEETPEESAFTEALRELRAAVAGFVERQSGRAA